jgi:hypothetical protein
VMARTAGRWSWTESAVDRIRKSPSPSDSLYLFGITR